MSSFESEQVRFVVSGGSRPDFPCKSDFQGVDGSLSVLSFGDSWDNLRVIPPTPQEPIVALAPEARLLVHWFENQVRVWSIDELGEGYGGEYTINKRYVLEMKLNVHLFTV
jgi:hypothetical protein